MTSIKETSTTVFFNGNSQAVRIPKELRVEATKARIVKRGGSYIVTPIPDPRKTATRAIRIARLAKLREEKPETTEETALMVGLRFLEAGWELWHPQGVPVGLRLEKGARCQHP